MFTQITFAIFLGIFAGIISGITPGIHINLVSAMLLASSAVLLRFLSPITLASFIISMSVTHSYLDFISSIFIGAPEESNALGVLPGHRMLLKGKGLFALKLTTLGNYYATLISVFLFPVFMLIIMIYPYIESYIKYFIVIVVVYMIARDRHKVWACIIFAASGILGLLAFNIPLLKDPLFPLLSGLFGISTLLYSFNDKNNMPEQSEYTDFSISTKLSIKAMLSGCFSGFITAVTPALGSGMASVMSSQITKGLGDAGFMMLLGAIQAFNFNLSLSAYYLLDKARNGSIIVIQQLIEKVTLNDILILLVALLISGSIGVWLAMAIGKLFLKIMNKINYQKLVMCVIAFIILLAFILSGWIGLLLLTTSTAVGLIPAIKKTSRTMAMGCLIVPVIIFLFGI